MSAPEHVRDVEDSTRPKLFDVREDYIEMTLYGQLETWCRATPMHWRPPAMPGPWGWLS